MGRAAYCAFPVLHAENVNRCFQLEWFWLTLREKNTHKRKEYENETSTYKDIPWVATHVARNPIYLMTSGQLLSRSETTDQSSSHK